MNEPTRTTQFVHMLINTYTCTCLRGLPFNEEHSRDLCVKMVDLPVDECAVCTDAPWEPVRVGSCGHVFCRRCLAEVIQRCPTGARCPLCRGDLPNDAVGWLAEAPMDIATDQHLHDQHYETWLRRRSEAEEQAAHSIPVMVSTQLHSGANASAILSLSVEVRQTGGSADIAAMFMDGIRVAFFSDADSGEPDVVEQEMAPFTVSCTFPGSSTMPEVVTVEIDWKKRLRLPSPLLTLQHRVQEVPNTSRWEVALPQGLTLARVIERTRPKSRVGVGAPPGMERPVY